EPAAESGSALVSICNAAERDALNCGSVPCAATSAAASTQMSRLAGTEPDENSGKLTAPGSSARRYVTRAGAAMKTGSIGGVSAATNPLMSASAASLGGVAVDAAVATMPLRMPAGAAADAAALPKNTVSSVVAMPADSNVRSVLSTLVPRSKSSSVNVTNVA